MPLTPTGVTITPQRDAGSGGNPNWQNLTPISNAVFVLSNPARVFGGQNMAQGTAKYLEEGSLFVPRGSNLQDGDRVEFQGKKYGVVGDALWDFDHPFTGADFGYVEFVIRKGG